jgi:DNA-binding transcriptional ArsR family regulator
MVIVGTRMRVVNVGGSRRLPAIELDVSPVYDFLVSPIVARPMEFEADEYEATAGWLATVRERGGESLLNELERRDETRRTMTHELLALSALAPDGPKRVAPFLDAVEGAAPDDLARLLLIDRCGKEEDEEAPEVVDAAIAGDRAAVSRVLAPLQGEERRRAALWLTDPAGVQAEVVGWLRRWQERVFAPEEERLLAIVQRDATAKQRVRDEHGVEGLLGAIGGTLRLVFGPNVQRVVLAPSVFSRPAIFTIEHDRAGLQVLLCPVADESLEAPEPLAPPRALLRLYKALGDETRLKILRLVADEELYATEIAERLGLSKATVSHHMVLLRAAGLVEVLGERKAERYYALHRPTLDEPTALLKRFLHQEGTRRAAHRR